MPGTFPVGRNAYHDPMLSNYAVQAFDKQGMGLIVDQIVPTVPVPKQSGFYRIFDKDAWMRIISNDLRAPRTAPEKVTFRTSTDTYFAHNYALAADIALEDIANADAPMRLRENHADLLILSLKRSQEHRVSQMLTASGGPGTIVQQNGAAAWTAVDSADILGQVSSAHMAIWKNTGLAPNTLVIDKESLEMARRNARLLAGLGFINVRAGELSDEELRVRVFKVERLVVAEGVANWAAEGQTASMSPIWGATALFCYANPQARTDASPNYAMRFRWTDPQLPYRTPAGEPLALNVFRSVYDRAGEPKVEVLETGYYQGEKITASEMAYLIKTR